MPALLLFQNLFQSLFIAYRPLGSEMPTTSHCQQLYVPYVRYNTCSIYDRVVPIYLFRGSRGVGPVKLFSFRAGIGKLFTFLAGIGKLFTFLAGIGKLFTFLACIAKLFTFLAGIGKLFTFLDSYWAIIYFSGQVLGNYLFSEKIAILFMVQLFFSNPCSESTR